MSASDISRHMQVMELMELTSLKRSLVGSPGQSGLSVEQRKRLTIGVELVASPSIVFMVRYQFADIAHGFHKSRLDGEL